eukprot:1509539-Amphidinium_carterae.1
MNFGHSAGNGSGHCTGEQNIDEVFILLQDTIYESQAAGVEPRCTMQGVVSQIHLPLSAQCPKAQE